MPQGETTRTPTRHAPAKAISPQGKRDGNALFRLKVLRYSAGALMWEDIWSFNPRVPPCWVISDYGLLAVAVRVLIRAWLIVRVVGVVLLLSVGNRSSTVS